MSERKKLYRPHVSWSDRGATVWCHYGYLSECGEWLDGGDTRWRRTDDWFETEAEAHASCSPKLVEMACKILGQAAELKILAQLEDDHVA